MDKIPFNPMLAIHDIINSPTVYLYLKELEHPSPGIKINKYSNQLFPNNYYSIFISDKKLSSKKQLEEPGVIKLWSTIGIADSCGNNNNLAIDTCSMIATFLTFSGNEVFVNDKIFKPSYL